MAKGLASGTVRKVAVARGGTPGGKTPRVVQKTFPTPLPPKVGVK